jgi:GT2 family glycosyltransferase
MSEQQRVAVVLVTFNRKDMLLSCLRGLLGQSRPCERIFLIDNASTDGTRELLQAEGYLDHAQITYTRMPENTGGAGGFHEGLQQASAGGFDWYWLLDDDVEPEPQALQQLLSYRHISECIHPLVVYEDGSQHEWEHTFDPTTTFQCGLHNLSFRNGKDWCVMRVACFEGMLVSHRVVERVGLPDRDFFVSGDDGLFGFKAALHTNVIYVQSARLLKKIKPGDKASPFKIYYDIRNRFLLRRKIGSVVWIAPYTRYIFMTFILLASYGYVKRASFARAHLLAAYRAVRDGLAGRTGRGPY